MTSGYVSITQRITGPERIDRYRVRNVCTLHRFCGPHASSTAMPRSCWRAAPSTRPTPLAMGGFCSARAMSTRNDDPTRASRPWDIDRDGFVLSNGAGCVVLEELEHAKAPRRHASTRS